MAEPFRLLITGSRDWADYDRVRLEIGQVVTERIAETGDPYPPITVVHGAAKGADLLAAKAAEEFRLRHEPHPADWKANDRRAGYIRNEEMVAAGADLCLCFVLPCAKAACADRTPHDTHGTGHCAGLARRAGIPVRRIDG